jgi:hypothetical protein
VAAIVANKEVHGIRWTMSNGACADRKDWLPCFILSTSREGGRVSLFLIFNQLVVVARRIQAMQTTSPMGMGAVALDDGGSIGFVNDGVVAVKKHGVRDADDRCSSSTSTQLLSV